jgi:hypothetical protein
MRRFPSLGWGFLAIVLLVSNAVVVFPPRHVHRQALHSPPQEHNTRAATERARDAQGGHSSGHNAHIRHLLISITSP